MASSDSKRPNTPAAAPQSSHTRQKQDSIAATQKRLRDRLLIALAGIAGYIDALSYVALGHIFVANITGTTVLLGVNLAQGHAPFAMRAYMSLGGFLVGVSGAALLIGRRMSREVWPRSVTATLAVEVGVLLIFSAMGLTLGMGRTVYVLIGLAACAMGLQSVAVRTLGVADVTTTYITGTWVGLLAGVTRRLRVEVETSDKRRPPHLASLYPQERDARLLLVYILAAALCGALTNIGGVAPRIAVIPLAPALAATVLIAARGFRASVPRAHSAYHNQ